jgi:hypothetical protein
MEGGPLIGPLFLFFDGILFDRIFFARFARIASSELK